MVLELSKAPEETLLSLCLEQSKNEASATDSPHFSLVAQNERPALPRGDRNERTSY